MKSFFCSMIFLFSLSLFGSDPHAGHGHNASDKQVYACPMHPNIKQNEPGTCPICGMELVAVKKKKVDREESGETLQIDKVSRQLAGIATETVSARKTFQALRAVGSLAPSESLTESIAAYFEARIEDLKANYVGFKIKKDEILATVYSPKLYSAQVEFLQSLGQGELTKKIHESAKNKLIEFGMSQKQIENLKLSKEAKSRISLHSPVSGTVLEKNVLEGQYIKTGQKLFTVSDLGTLWLLLDLYPEEVSHLSLGMSVDVTVDSKPELIHSGEISFISPTIDAKKRTLSVRVVLKNHSGNLRPGEYATAKIKIPLPEGAITVPLNSVLSLGERSLVYLEKSPGKFGLREVTRGVRTSEGRVHIVKGLSEGDRIATDGVFLLDSQMQLEGKTSLVDLTEGQQSQNSGHNH